jgi:hypothetical protein
MAMPVFAKAQEKASPSPAGRKPSSWNFAGQAQRGPIRAILFGLGLQTKLRVSRPDDPAELEADQVAERVVSLPAAPGTVDGPPSTPPAPPGLPPAGGSPSAPSAPPANGSAAPPSISKASSQDALARECSECDEEEPETMVHTAAKDGDASELPEDLPSRVAALRQGGMPLPPALRADMEGRFGRDFSGVRIHTGSDAESAAEDLHAHAFTTGEHISFASGAYQPGTSAGRKLLAHELTHVVQQRGDLGRIPAPAQRADASAVYRDEDEPGFFDSIVNWGRDQVFSLVRRYAPGLEPILREGPFNWLKRQLGSAFNSLADRVRALIPAGALEQLSATFGPLVDRASEIVSALASGDCGPLLQAIDDVKNFITEVAGQAWDRLTELLRPIGDFFSDLWNSFGAPAVQWR